MYQSPIRIRTACLLALAILSCPQPLLAHHPIFTEDAATSPDTAIKIADPAISQVVYREITEKSPQVWLTFQAEKDFKLFIQIGVPVIDRFKDFRPAMVVIGPGLPAQDAPFKLPENTGAKVFTTKEVAKPRFIALLGSIAQRKNTTPAQIALAWLLAQKPWIVPIPGTTKLHRLEENIGAVSVELTPDDLNEIDTAASKIQVQGARYPEKLEQMTGR